MASDRRSCDDPGHRTRASTSSLVGFSARKEVEKKSKTWRPNGASAAAVTVLDDQDHALHVASAMGAAERGDGVLDVGGGRDGGSAARARRRRNAPRRAPGIDAARGGWVDGH